MNINVKVGSTPINVRSKSTNPLNATVASGIIVPRVLNELLDVDTTNVSDKYLIMYDAVTQKYIAVNPDEALSAASTTELTQPGLPEDFKNQLDVDLDDRIDLDGGTWV